MMAITTATVYRSSLSAEKVVVVPNFDAHVMGRVPPRPTILWVIDDSGSMGNVIRPICDAVQRCSAKGDEGILFHSRARRIANIQNFTHGYGATNFQEAFLLMTSTIAEMNEKEGVKPLVFFLTDGQDNSHFPWKDARGTAFINDIVVPSLAEGSSGLVAVGFTDQHDLSIMKRIYERLPEKVSFHYATDGEHCQDLIEGCVNIRTITARVQQKTTMTFDLNENGNKGYLFPSDWDGTFRFKDGSVVRAEINEVKGEMADMQYMLHSDRKDWTYESVTLNTKRALRVHDKKIRRDVINRLSEIRSELDQRQNARVQDSFSRSATLLAQSSSRSCSFKPSLQRRLNQRLLDNDDAREKRLKAVEKEVSDGIEDFDEGEMRCIFTLNGALEAAKEGDALSIPIKVARSPSTPVAPGTLRIISIGYSPITFTTFEDIAKATGLGDDEQTGGFDPKKRDHTIIKELGISECNAVLPLFIHEEHWKVARHHMRAALGFACALDERAYTPTQRHVVPALLAYHAAYVQETGVPSFVTEALLDTARACVEMDKIEDVKEHSIPAYVVLRQVHGLPLTGNERLNLLREQAKRCVKDKQLNKEMPYVRFLMTFGLANVEALPSDDNYELFRSGFLRKHADKEARYRSLFHALGYEEEELDDEFRFSLLLQTVSPVDNVYEPKEIFQAVRDAVKDLQRQELLRQELAQKVERYIMDPDTTCFLEYLGLKHLYEGRALKLLHRLTRMRGGKQIPNAQAKIAALSQASWEPAPKNLRPWTV